MSYFTSDRERRLWLWTIAAQVAIYATLGPARVVAGFLRDQNLLRLSFAVAVGVLVVAFLAVWLRRKPGWGELLAVIGVGFAYWGMFLRLGTPEGRTHLIEYGIIAALIHMALVERARHDESLKGPAAVAVLLAILLGTIDECIQWLLPNRVFDPADVFFNALAAFMAVAARLAIAPQRGPSWRVWFWWLMGGAWGLGAGFYARFAQPVGLETLLTSPPLMWSGLLAVSTGFTAVGAIQWFLIRRYLDRAWRWIPATMVGAAGVVVAVLILTGVDADRGWLIGTGTFGLAAGIPQWLVLRGQVPRAGWWIVASTVGWVAGIPAGEAAGFNALGAVYGLVTGSVIVLLLRQIVRAEGSAERRAP